jgi:hypothetical protein
VQDGFIDKYIANRDKIEAGMNDDEISQLRTSISDGSLAFNQQDIAARRERRALYTGRGASGLDATLYTLVGGLADPIGLAAGEGVGTAFKLAGVGSKALWAKRAYGAATASQAAEFAGANVAITAGMDAAGEYTTPEDYATAAAFGAGLGLATAPFHYRGAARTVEQHFAEQAANAHAEKLATMADAERELGPGATPEQVMARTQEKASQRPAMAVETALADQPDNLKVMSADNVLTKDEELKARVHEEYGLDGIADDSERDVATEAMGTPRTTICTVSSRAMAFCLRHGMVRAGRSLSERFSLSLSAEATLRATAHMTTHLSVRLPTRQSVGSMLCV